MQGAAAPVAERGRLSALRPVVLCPTFTICGISVVKFGTEMASDSL